MSEQGALFHVETDGGAGRYLALRRRRREGYAAQLLAAPPVRSCNEGEVGKEAASRAAARFAQADEARIDKAEKAAGLVLVDLDRLIALEQALRDWLRGSEDDRASGGNGSEDIDFDELESRSLTLLDQSFLGHLKESAP